MAALVVSPLELFRTRMQSANAHGFTGTVDLFLSMIAINTHC